MFRPIPSCPGPGLANIRAPGKNTGPATPALRCNCAFANVITPGANAARFCPTLFAVRNPERTVNGSPD